MRARSAAECAGCSGAERPAEPGVGLDQVGARGVRGPGLVVRVRGQVLRRRIHQKEIHDSAPARARKIPVSYHWRGQ